MTITAVASTGQAEAEQLAAELRETSHEVEFPDHSAGSEGDDWVLLSDMTDPFRAGNNCHAATWAVLAHVTERLGLDLGQDIHAVEVLFTDGCHWFPAFTATDGTIWALDPTTRQFHDSAPFLSATPLTQHLFDVYRWVAEGFRDRAVSVTINGVPRLDLLPVSTATQNT